MKVKKGGKERDREGGNKGRKENTIIRKTLSDKTSQIHLPLFLKLDRINITLLKMSKFCL